MVVVFAVFVMVETVVTDVMVVLVMVVGMGGGCVQW